MLTAPPLAGMVPCCIGCHFSVLNCCSVLLLCLFLCDGCAVQAHSGLRCGLSCALHQPRGLCRLLRCCTVFSGTGIQASCMAKVVNGTHTVAIKATYSLRRLRRLSLTARQQPQPGAPCGLRQVVVRQQHAFEPSNVGAKVLSDPDKAFTDTCVKEIDADNGSDGWTHMQMMQTVTVVLPSHAPVACRTSQQPQAGTTLARV